jgi:hypothetical protein
MYFKQNGADRNHKNCEVDKELHRSARLIASVSQTRESPTRFRAAIDTILEPGAEAELTALYLVQSLRGPLLG